MVGIPELGTSEYTARVGHFLDAETCESSIAAHGMGLDDK